MLAQINVGICGAPGYSGQALIKLIQTHPKMNLSVILARDPAAISNHAVPVVKPNQLDLNTTPVDVIFLATPHEASLTLVEQLQKHGITIIDLSGAFRLPADEFETWYKQNHTQPNLINQAVYGLMPWNKHLIQSAKLIANPGCYSTCALMTLLPLLKNKLIKPDNIIIDAKSGVSGAGKKANLQLMFGEMQGNFFPYKIGHHQHTPEILNTLNQLTQQHCNIHFVTHMLPVMRGISMSIYADLNAHWDNEDAALKAINTAFEAAYYDYPLVKLDAPLGLKQVVNTPFTHISFTVQNNKVWLFASIDNLLKGAASQAIENFNALYQLPLTTGLLQKEAVL